MTLSQPVKGPSITVQMLMEATEAGDIKTVKTLLASGVEADAVMSNGETALMRAALRGHLDVAQLLLDAGANINAQKKDGLTALIAAASFGHSEVVRLLLENGADIKVTARDGMTACQRASAGGYGELAALLQEAETNRAMRFVAVSNSNVATPEAEETHSPEGVNVGLESSAAHVEDHTENQAGESSVRWIGLSEQLPAEPIYLDNQVELEASELFTLDEPPQMVVPLAEVNDPTASALLAHNQHKLDSDAAVPPSPVAEETLITSHASTVGDLHNNPAGEPESRSRPFIIQSKERLHSWPPISIMLAVTLASGVITFAVLRSKEQPSVERHNQSPTKEISSQSLQPLQPVVPAPPTSRQDEQAGMGPTNLSNEPTSAVPLDVSTPAKSEPTRTTPSDVLSPANATMVKPKDVSKQGNASSLATANGNLRSSKREIDSGAALSREVNTRPNETQIISSTPQKQEKDRQSAPQTVVELRRVPPQSIKAHEELPPPVSAPTPSASPKKKVIQWP